VSEESVWKSLGGRGEGNDFRVRGVFSIVGRRSVTLRGESFVYGDIIFKCLRPRSTAFKWNFEEIVTLRAFLIDFKTRTSSRTPSFPTSK
jgi:hypothetical protein